MYSCIIQVMQTNITVPWPALLAHITRVHSLSQGALAKAAGCDQSTVSRIASGVVKDPRASVAFQLLRLAGGKVELPALGTVKRPEASASTEAIG
jgi:transcriptional regulator with XRE-family HTH domain